MVAPPEYRINAIMVKNRLSWEAAMDFITRVEKERQAYRHAVHGSGNGKPEIFDLTINRASFSTDMVADMIICAVRNKHILDDYIQKSR